MKKASIARRRGMYICAISWCQHGSWRKLFWSANILEVKSKVRAQAKTCILYQMLYDCETEDFCRSMNPEFHFSRTANHRLRFFWLRGCWRTCSICNPPFEGKGRHTCTRYNSCFWWSCKNRSDAPRSPSKSLFILGHSISERRRLFGASLYLIPSQAHAFFL